MNRPVEPIFFLIIYISAKIHCLAPFRYDKRSSAVVPSLLATVQTIIMGIIFAILTPLAGEYMSQKVGQMEKAPVLITLMTYINNGFEYFSITVIFIIVFRNRYCYINTLNRAMALSVAINDLRELAKPHLKKYLRFLRFRFGSVLLYGLMMIRGVMLMPGEENPNSTLINLAFGWFLYSHIAVITVSVFFYTAMNFTTQYLIMINNRIRIIMKSIEFISDNKDVTTKYERMSKYEEFSNEIDYLSCIYSEVAKICQGLLKIFSFPITLIFGSYVMGLVTQVYEFLFGF